MCGIAGLALAALAAWERGAAAAIAEASRHRGPDGRGEWESSDGWFQLGHARLAILDLSPAGAQPMANEDGTVWAVVNGEIYNFQDLRRELERQGHSFRSRSDSEVVVHLWERDGERLVDHLHGMFALCLVDWRRGVMFCARDRLGKKPLVYAETPRGVAVASEISALTGVPGVDVSVDPQSIGLYLLRNFRHVPEPFTMFRGMRRLPPGHAMTVRSGRIERIWRYWHPRLDPIEGGPAEVLGLLDRAVVRRMVADTEIAAMLSGGVDSTAVVDSMLRQGAGPVRTYALGRDGADEEIVRAARAAALLGTVHRAVFMEPDAHYEMLTALVARHGEPIALLPLVHAFQLCRAIRADGVKVVLAGHGADELFHGYSSHLDQARLDRLLPWVPAPLAKVAAALLPPGQWRGAAVIAGAPPGRRKAAQYLDEARHLWPGLMLAGPETRRAWEEPLAALLSAWMPDPAPRAYVEEAAITGLMVENAHSVTIAGDLPAMAAGVEVRCPFLDQEMVEFAWRLPWQIKQAGGGKAVLKRALEGRLPRDLLYAPKNGFGTNIQERDLYAGPWRDRVGACLDRLEDGAGVLASGAAATVWRRFLAAPDAAGAVLVAKLHALALALGRG